MGGSLYYNWMRGAPIFKFFSFSCWTKLSTVVKRLHHNLNFLMFAKSTFLFPRFRMTIQIRTRNVLLANIGLFSESLDVGLEIETYSKKLRRVRVRISPTINSKFMRIFPFRWSRYWSTLINRPPDCRISIASFFPSSLIRVLFTFTNYPSPSGLNFFLGVRKW